jgi:hypothetical protein
MKADEDGDGEKSGEGLGISWLDEYVERGDYCSQTTNHSKL